MLKLCWLDAATSINGDDSNGQNDASITHKRSVLHLVMRSKKALFSSSSVTIEKSFKGHRPFTIALRWTATSFIYLFIFKYVSIE